MSDSPVHLAEVIGVLPPPLVGPEEPVQNHQPPQFTLTLVGEEPRKPDHGLAAKPARMQRLEPIEVLRRRVTRLVEGEVENEAPRARPVAEMIFGQPGGIADVSEPVSYTHLRAHETDSYL